MNCSDIVCSIFRAVGMTQKEVAEKHGWSRTKMNDKIVRGSLRLTEFFEIMDTCGVEIVFQKKGTSEQITINKPGAGRRVKKMVDHVIYDTYRSNALANNFFADGKHMYTDSKATELYMDSEGRFFFAEYCEFDEKLDRITPVNGFVAAEFITKYGTKIHKEPQ